MFFTSNQFWRYGVGPYILLLIVLSLYPRGASSPIQEPGETSSGLLPQEGDNFKAIDDVVVYHLERGKRRSYKTGASYLQSLGNPPFGTSYEEGGILLVDSFVWLVYPLGRDMPRPKDTTSGLLAPTLAQGPAWWEPYTHWDKLGHAGVYGVLGFLLWKSYRAPKRRQRYTVVWALSVGTALGWSLEWAQAMMALGRAAEWGDLLMNTVGLVLGIGVGWGWESWRPNDKRSS